MYAILKQGVYTQDVWIFKTKEEAHEEYENFIEKDTDDYHYWELATGNSSDVFSWEVIDSRKKKPKTVKLYMFVNSYLWVTDPDLKQFSEKKSEAYNFNEDEDVIANPYKYKGFNVEREF